MNSTSVSPAPSLQSKRSEQSAKKSGAAFPDKWVSLFIGPHLSLFSIWTLLPIGAVLVMSLYDWNLLGTGRFVGLSNYQELTEDRLFWSSLGNTVRFAAVVTPAALFAGLILAVALEKPFRGRNMLRAVFYAPGVISGVATATVAAWILNTHYGVLNSIFEVLGISRQDWLNSRNAAFFALAGTTLWMRAGFCMVVYLAGLQEIPRELYDAARVDGAGAWSRFRYITWPMLSRQTTLLAVLNTVFSFHVFDLSYVMTGGGPAFTTTMLVQYMYESGFASQRQGYAASIAVMMFALMLLLTLAAGAANRRTRI